MSPPPLPWLGRSFSPVRLVHFLCRAHCSIVSVSLGWCLALGGRSVSSDGGSQALGVPPTSIIPVLPLPGVPRGAGGLEGPWLWVLGSKPLQSPALPRSWPGSPWWGQLCCRG